MGTAYRNRRRLAAPAFRAASALPGISSPRRPPDVDGGPGKRLGTPGAENGGQPKRATRRYPVRRPCLYVCLLPAELFQRDSTGPRKDRMKPAIAGAPDAAAKRSAPSNVRTGLDADAIGQALIDNLHCLQAKIPQHATRNDWYMALAYTVRDRMLDRYIQTLEAMPTPRSGDKVVAYLSAEFLIGPQLGNNLLNLGIWTTARAGAGRARPGPRRAARAGRGAGPRQRRPRPAGRVLHRLAGDARACRRSATASATSSASSTRRSATAGRSSSTDKWLRYGNPWEIAAPGDRVRREVRRPHRSVHRRATAATACAGCPSAWSTASPTTRRSSATASTRRNTAAAVEGRGAPSRSTSSAFNDGDYYGAVDEKIALREPSPRCSTRTTSRTRARSCGWSSSTSSSPARCRT